MIVVVPVALVCEPVYEAVKVPLNVPVVVGLKRKTTSHVWLGANEKVPVGHVVPLATFSKGAVGLAKAAIFADSEADIFFSVTVMGSEELFA